MATVAAPTALWPTKRVVRIVCTSDTHNDVPPPGSIPDGDIFIHAGDMTDDGTFEELKAAYDWIAALPHPAKIIIAGNHDLTLDPFHSGGTRAAYMRNLALFTSADAIKNGVYYISDSVIRITLPVSIDPTTGTVRPEVTLPIYGNPHQPEWLPTNYAFTYTPAPSAGAESAWANAPTAEDGVPIWVMHGAPKGRLDKIELPPWPLGGCPVAASKVYAARPRLCVFGHFHVSYGVEQVEYLEGGPGKVTNLLPPTAEEGVYVFAKDEGDKGGVFANVAWMTGEKRKVEKRNKPIVIDFELTCQ